MIRNKKRFIRLACAAVFCMAQCSPSPQQVAGGASGTEVSGNVVAGSVVAPDKKPLQGAVVRLRPANFLLDSLSVKGYRGSHSVLDTVTAANGFFEFESVLPDTYHVEITFNDSLSVVVSFRNIGVDSRIVLPLDTAFPVAIVAGNVVITNTDTSRSSVQVYGMDRRIIPDSNGNFSMRVPRGKHELHISAYQQGPGTINEFDGMDISLGVASGENKNIGSMKLQPPSSPCGDYVCDSMTVRKILDFIGLPGVAVDSAVVVQNRRITGLVLRKKPITNKLPWEIVMLTELRLLDLGQTGSTSVFPEIQKIEKLESLRLDGNLLTKVPPGIGYLRQLKELNLSGNNLDSLPASIVNVRPTAALDLSNNRLCAVDSARTAWANTYDPDWKATQRCP
jgi:hypothetical protein